MIIVIHKISAQYAVTVCGTKAYFGGGGEFDFSYLDIVQVYDAEIPGFENSPLNMGSGVARVLLAATTVDTLVFFAGGYSYGFPVDTVDIYDTVQNTWSEEELG